MRILYEPEDVKFWTNVLLHTSQQQKGGGISGFEGIRYQRGSGLGSFFQGLFRAALPVISSIGKTVGKQALTSGAAMIQDLASGQKIEHVVKTRGREAANQLLTKATNAVKQTGSGNNFRGQKRRGKAVKRKKNKRNNKPAKLANIFDTLP